MRIDVDKKDLISLIKGFDPSYEQMDDPRVASNGYFAASYGVWKWNGSFDNMSEEQLYELYVYLKDYKSPPTYAELKKESIIRELEATAKFALEKGNTEMFYNTYKEIIRMSGYD